MDRVHDKRPSFERPLLSPYLVTHTLLIMSTPLIVDECIQHPYDQIYFQWLCILKHYFMICSLLCGWEDCGNCAQHCRQPIHDEHSQSNWRTVVSSCTHTRTLEALACSLWATCAFIAIETARPAAIYANSFEVLLGRWKDFIALFYRFPLRCNLAPIDGRSIEPNLILLQHWNSARPTGNFLFLACVTYFNLITHLFHELDRRTTVNLLTCFHNQSISLLFISFIRKGCRQRNPSKLQIAHLKKMRLGKYLLRKKLKDAFGSA